MPLRRKKRHVSRRRRVLTPELIQRFLYSTLTSHIARAEKKEDVGATKLPEGVQFWRQGCLSMSVSMQTYLSKLQSRSTIPSSFLLHVGSAMVRKVNGSSIDIVNFNRSSTTCTFIFTSQVLCRSHPNTVRDLAHGFIQTPLWYQVQESLQEIRPTPDTCPTTGQAAVSPKLRHP